MNDIRFCRSLVNIHFLLSNLTSQKENLKRANLNPNPRKENRNPNRSPKRNKSLTFYRAPAPYSIHSCDSSEELSNVSASRRLIPIALIPVTVVLGGIYLLGVWLGDVLRCVVPCIFLLSFPLHFMSFMLSISSRQIVPSLDATVNVYRSCFLGRLAVVR